jgi:hypothetical protein
MALLAAAHVATLGLALLGAEAVHIPVIFNFLDFPLEFWFYSHIFMHHPGRAPYRDLTLPHAGLLGFSL